MAFWENDWQQSGLNLGLRVEEPERYELSSVGGEARSLSGVSSIGGFVH